MIGKKVLTKIVLLLIVLFGVTILTFVYTNLSPVDAAEALAVRRYSRPTAEQIELVREELGLDKPILQQYGSWLWNALHGDFGNSYNTGRSIVEELAASIQPTLIMAVLALLFSTVICIPLGVLSASRKGGLADKASTCSELFVCHFQITGSVSCFYLLLLCISLFSALWGQTV